MTTPTHGRLWIALACTTLVALPAAVLAQESSVVPDFTWEPLEPLSGSQVCFLDRSTPEDQVKRRQWNSPFGGSEQPQACIFIERAGEYQVTLTVWDLNERPSSISKILVVRGRAPVADFVYEPINPTTSDVVRLRDRSYDPDGRIVERVWESDYSPEAKSFQEFISVRFAEQGQYTVRLTVRDDVGQIASTEKTITVTRSTLFEDVQSEETPIPPTGVPLVVAAVAVAAAMRRRQ